MAKNVWGVFKYNLKYCNLAQELIDMYNKYPDRIMLSYYINRERYKASNTLFDLQNINFYLYYLDEVNDDEMYSKLYLEIDNNEKLNDWFDTDSYDLEDETVAELKADTPVTLQMLKNILSANTVFEKMLYRNNKYK